MKCLSIAAAALAVLAPAAASAEEWWLVAGAPDSRKVWFVDAESIMSNGATASFQLMQADMRGAAPATMAQVDCAATSGDRDAEAVRRFVCATPEERMALGAMLGSLTPELAANAVLSSQQGSDQRFAGLGERQ